MYPSRFRYEAPRSLAEALDLKSTYGDEAKVLAGGQSLIPLIKLRFAAPEMLVDINNLPGLDYHDADADGTLRFGALCRHRDLERSTLLRDKPAHDGGGRAADRRPDRAQPRHAGRLVVPRRPAGRLGVGDARARRRARGGQQRRAGARSRSTEFVIGPFQNSLRPSEIAVEARVPAPTGTRVRHLPQAGAPGRRLRHGRRRRRPGDRPAARSSRAGIALTGVGPANIKATAAEQALVGKPLDATHDRRGGASWPPRPPQPKTDHRGSADFKRHVVRTFVTRALGGGAAASHAA